MYLLRVSGKCGGIDMIGKVLVDLLKGEFKMWRRPKKPYVTVYGSSRCQKKNLLDNFQAKLFGQRMGKHGIGIITGGGDGIMGAVATGCKSAGGTTIGVSLDIVNEEPRYDLQTISIHTRHFFTRKFFSVKYSNAFVLFPGGFGTLDELFEVLTLIQTYKLPLCPVYLLGNTEYWDKVLLLIKKQVSLGLIDEHHLDYITVISNIYDAPDIIADYLLPERLHV